MSDIDRALGQILEDMLTRAFRAGWDKAMRHEKDADGRTLSAHVAEAYDDWRGYGPGSLMPYGTEAAQKIRQRHAMGALKAADHRNVQLEEEMRKAAASIPVTAQDVAAALAPEQYARPDTITEVTPPSTRDVIEHGDPEIYAEVRNGEGKLVRTITVEEHRESLRGAVDPGYPDYLEDDGRSV